MQYRKKQPMVEVLVSLGQMTVILHDGTTSGVNAGDFLVFEDGRLTQAMTPEAFAKEYEIVPKPDPVVLKFTWPKEDDEWHGKERGPIWTKPWNPTDPRPMWAAPSTIQYRPCEALPAYYSVDGFPVYWSV